MSLSSGHALVIHMLVSYNFQYINYRPGALQCAAWGALQGQKAVNSEELKLTTNRG